MSAKCECGHERAGHCSRVLHDKSPGRVYEECGYVNCKCLEFVAVAEQPVSK